jgi:integrase
LHDRLKAESWRVKNLGDKPKYTWQEAVVRWLNENGHKKSLQTDKEILRYLNQHLCDKRLDEINRDQIDLIKQHKQSKGASNGTVNRMLALIRAILNAATKDWEWLETAPNVKMLPIQNAKIRWITKQEASRLFQELPEHLAAMARFSLATGLRESNVVNLKWSQVDLQRRCSWVDAENSKSKKAIAVPLNDDALAVLRSQIGKNEIYVFTYKGEPVTRANNHAWRKALERAGISDFRWHDLRHTWASWHVQNGTPLHVLKELGGWADLTMVLRYAHLSSEHLSGYANNSSQITGHDKLLSYPQKNPESENRYRA